MFLHSISFQIQVWLAPTCVRDHSLGRFRLWLREEHHWRRAQIETLRLAANPTPKEASLQEVNVFFLNNIHLWFWRSLVDSLVGSKILVSSVVAPRHVMLRVGSQHLFGMVCLTREKTFTSCSDASFGVGFAADCSVSIKVHLQR